MNILIRYLLLFSSMLLLGIGVIFEEPMVLLVATLLIFTHNIAYSLKKFYERIIFFSFNVTFFIFLIGRIVVSGIFGYKIELRGLFGLDFEDKETLNMVIICLYIALLALCMGYALIQKYDLKFLKAKKELSPGYLHSLRLFSLVFFYFCMVFRLIYVFEMKQTAVTEGYYESFMTFKSSLPSILLQFSQMYDVAFFAYLATKPTKKKSLFPVLLYIGEGLFSAMAGRRSILILNLFIVFIYYCIRSIPKTENEEKKEKKEKKWLGKFEWTLALVGLPVLMAFMTFIGKARADFTGQRQSSSLFDSISEFFYSQGVSANVIGYTKMYAEQLPTGKWYTFGPLVEFIDGRIIKPLNGMSRDVGQTVEMATNGHLFTHAISFLIMPSAYLIGYGYGSSFIAELYADFSYVGVFIGSIVYGIIIYVLYYMLRHSNYILVIFALMMARSILFAPRAAALSFIVSSFSVTKIAAVVFIIIGSKILHSFIGNRRFALC
ncbi:O-antigen polysaccharide polymerase Wzy family protein [Bacillus hominis]|uniref:O-antigen polysaccharide polymerase Wzy family protein n=1 Tax=Bacillus hominis TaxID=2817478 RepID=UPI003D650D56